MTPSVHHKKPNLEGPRLCAECGDVYSKTYGMNNAKCSACIGLYKYYKNHEKRKLYFKLRARKERMEHYEKVIARERRRNRDQLKEKYGITRQQYVTLLAEQGGVCAICSGTKVLTKNSKNLYVDHDHTTNKVRALLCGHCNTALGHMKDDPERLEKAAAYLRKHGK